MTLANKINKLFTVGLTAGSLVLSSNLMAQQSDANFCAEVAKCNEDKPKKPAKQACETLYNGRGMCLTDTVAESLGAVESTAGYCPGPATQMCYDTTNIPNIVDALEDNSLAIIDLRSKHAGLKNTVNNFIKSSEQLHRVLGKALEPELKDLEQKQAVYETMCQEAANKENCLPAWMSYQNAINHLAETIRQNLLDTPENERLRMSILIDNKIHDYMKQDIERTKQMVDDSTVKLSFMGTLGYQFSALNASADSDVSHIFTPGIEACLYTPSELFGLCLTGNLFVGSTTDGGLGSERIYNFSLPVEIDTQDHGEYSNINTVETDVNVARITYGSVGMTAKLGGFMSDHWRLAFLASLNLEVGREYTATRTEGTNVLSYQGVPVDTHKVSDVEETDGIFLEVVPQAGAEVCYDFGINRTCAYGKLGPSFPTGDGEDITLNGGFGLGTGFHF